MATKFPKKKWVYTTGKFACRYRQTVESFTSYKKPFWQVNGDLYVQYQQQLKSLAKGRPIVGISWSGGYWVGAKASKRARNRKLASDLGVMVNLQYGDTSQEEQFVKEKGFEFVTFPESITKKSDDWLAIAAACDGIIQSQPPWFILQEHVDKRLV